MLGDVVLVAVIIRFATPLSLPEYLTLYPKAESVCHLAPFTSALILTVESRLLFGCTLLPSAGPLPFLKAKKQNMIIGMASSFFITSPAKITLNRTCFVYTNQQITS